MKLKLGILGLGEGRSTISAALASDYYELDGYHPEDENLFSLDLLIDLCNFPSNQS